MILQLGEVLDSGTLAAIQENLADPELFQDGRVTAGHQAKKVKSNLQARRTDLTEEIRGKVEKAMHAHPVFKSAARPKELVRVLLSRYEPGMTYGTHVDDALMGGTRTDLSFTLFLSEPADYSGGALWIEGLDQDREVKLPAGSAVVYPTNALHRVQPVTAGVRLAAVGWVRSFVRDPGDREILFDLDNALAAIPDEEANAGVRNRLAKVRSSLLRRWAED